MTAANRVLTEPTNELVAAGPAHECGVCGVVFWMTARFYKNRLDDHGTWYCPNGHGRMFSGESEAQKYKRLHKQAEDAAAATRAERDQAEAGRRAWKGQATKLRNRAAAGACPFCGAQVYQLARHVARKHADEPHEPEPTA